MGCQQSSPAAAAAAAPRRTPIKGVGQTERMVSRAHRVQQKLQAANDNNNNAGSTSNASSANSNINISAPPKLDPSGHLMPEEVVRRTQCSIFSKKVTLGTLEHPILMEVSRDYGRVWFVACCLDEMSLLLTNSLATTITTTVRTLDSARLLPRRSSQGKSRRIQSH